MKILARLLLGLAYIPTIVVVCAVAFMGFISLLASSQFDASQMTDGELLKSAGWFFLIAFLALAPIFFIVRSHAFFERQQFDSSVLFSCLAICTCLVAFVLFALTLRGQFNPVRIYHIESNVVRSCPTNTSDSFITGSASDTDYIEFGIGNNESSKSPTAIAATAQVPVNKGEWSVALEDLAFTQGTLERIKPGSTYGISATRKEKLYVTMTKWGYCI